MLVRSAGDRATSAQPPPPDPCPSLRRSLSYLPPFSARHLLSVSLHSARSPSSFLLLRDISTYASDAAATIARARTRHHLRATFRCNLCADIRGRGSVHEGRTTYVYVRVCANARSTLALCKSVRYLDTCKGKCVRAYAHPPLPFHPRLRFVFSPLHPSLTKGWTRHWRSSSVRGALYFLLLFSLSLSVSSFSPFLCSRLDSIFVPGNKVRLNKERPILKLIRRAD